MTEKVTKTSMREGGFLMSSSATSSKILEGFYPEYCLIYDKKWVQKMAYNMTMGRSVLVIYRVQWCYLGRLCVWKLI